VVLVKSWKAEFLTALFLGVVGGYFVRTSLALPPPDEAGVPGAGSVPMLLGGLIVAGAVILLVSALLKNREETLELGNWKPAFGLASLIIGALIFEPLGFLFSTFLFLTAGFVVLGEADWRRAAPAAALCASALWLLFTKLLGVGLPYGLIGEILFR
jgi:putative tricarboxylic transport membrane protein